MIRMSKAIEARLISKSAGGKRAQVVVKLYGSITRHVHLEEGRWMGHNPDEPAVVRMEQAERLLEKAISNYEELQPLTEISLESIKQMRAEFLRAGLRNAALPEEFCDLRGVLFGWAQRRTISDMKARIEASVAGAATAFENAKNHFERVRVPTKVQFTF